MQRSKLLIGFVTLFAVGGLGVAAFAADGGTGGTVETSTTTTLAETTTTTTSTTVAPPTTTLATPDQSSTPEDVTQGTGVARSTDGCGDGTYANHGDYVSSVAHDPGRQAGDVPAAAQSDCGKPLTAVGGSTTPDGQTAATEPPPAVSPSAPGNSGGNGGGGNGNGHAGGNGKPVK